jgi:hypothetical protein
VAPPSPGGSENVMLGKQARIGEWSVEPALDALRRGGEFD